MQSLSLRITGTTKSVLILITVIKHHLRSGSDWNKLGGGVTKMLNHYKWYTFSTIKQNNYLDIYGSKKCK